MAFRFAKIISQIFAFGFGALEMVSLFLSPFSNIAFWVLTWGQVIGIVFILSVFWAVIQLNYEVARLNNTKPKLRVTVPSWLGNPDNFCINIENIGEVGMIQAHIEITKGEEFVQHKIHDYYAYWKNTENVETELLKGQSDRILIARIGSAPPKHDIQHFTLYFYDRRNDRNSCTDSCSWGLPDTLDPEFTFRILISTKPSLRESTITKVYHLTPSKGLVELA